MDSITTILSNAKAAPRYRYYADYVIFTTPTHTVFPM